MDPGKDANKYTEQTHISTTTNTANNISNWSEEMTLSLKSLQHNLEELIGSPETRTGWVKACHYSKCRGNRNKSILGSCCIASLVELVSSGSVRELVSRNKVEGN